MRDFDKNPYSPDEQRIAQFFYDVGLGGGDDPIGFIIASHQALAAERNALKADIGKLKDPVAVYLNMLSGGIAKPSWANIKHLYPEQFK